MLSTKCQIIKIVLTACACLLLTVRARSAWADEPAPTPLPTAAITPAVTVVETQPAKELPPATLITATLPTATLPPETLTPESSPTPTLEPTATPTTLPTPTLVPTATPTALPTPTLIPAPGYIAVLVSDIALPVGSEKSSQVLIALHSVQPGVCGFEFALAFDPQLVQSANVEIAPAFASNGWSAQINHLDSGYGDGKRKVGFTFAQSPCSPVSDTNNWAAVATITWQGLAEGESLITVGGAADARPRFMLSDETIVAASELYHGNVSVRIQGQVEGAVYLQGCADHSNILIYATLGTARTDQAYTAPDGSFAIDTSQGEGFYTLVASRPGYLTAQSSSPIRVTMGSTVLSRSVTLLGGDVNGDGRIDVRDLSFIAWHFSGQGSPAEYSADADINGDQVVDISDLAITAGNYGRQGPIPWQAATVN